MKRYDLTVQALAVCLSSVAGYIDALAFMHLNGFFVSFMSGNSTRLGVGISQATSDAKLAAWLIASFVVGVIIGSIVGRLAGERRRVTVLLVLATFLALAAISSSLGLGFLSVTIMAIAMGTENAVFEKDGDVGIGLTYMTGALVKAGQRIAAALAGGDRIGWLSYIMLWLGLVTGAAAGAIAYPQFGLSALWAAVAVVLTLAALSPLAGHGERSSQTPA